MQQAIQGYRNAALVILALITAVNPAQARKVTKDFNGDGYSDLVWENVVTGQRAIWLLKNGILWKGYYLPTLSADWHIVGIADCDGDGSADLILKSTKIFHPAIWFLTNGVPKADPWNLNNVLSPGASGIYFEDVSFTRGEIAAVLNTPTAASYFQLVHENVNTGQIELSDIARDSYSQLGSAFYNAIWTDDSYYLYPLWFASFCLTTTPDTGGPPTGDPYAGQVLSPVTLPSGYHIVATGDFTGAGYGDTDLVLENSATGQCMIWVTAGEDCYERTITLPKLPWNWHIAGAGDFNGDGFSDLVLQNLVTGQRAIWFLQNAHLLRGSYLPTVPVQWHIVNH